jgi:hypothetical protein
LIGTQVPDVKIDFKFGSPGDISLRERCKGKKVGFMCTPFARFCSSMMELLVRFIDAVASGYSRGAAWRLYAYLIHVPGEDYG